MLSKIYVVSNSPYVKSIETIYKYFGFRSPLQFVPAVQTLTPPKKNEVYTEHQIRYHPNPLPYCHLFYPSTDRDYEYAVNHWLVWKTIESDILRGSLRIHDDSYFLILDNDISFNHTMSNSMLYYDYILSDIKKMPILHSWDIIYLSYEADFHRKMSAEKTILITPRVGIPTHRVHLNGAYLLSIRGLRKLLTASFHKEIQPINKYFHYLQHDSMHTPIADLLYIYYSTVPVFKRHLHC